MPGSKREKVHFEETLKLECSTFCQLAVQFSLSLNFDVSRDVQICEFAIRNPSLTLGQAHDSKESKISSMCFNLRTHRCFQYNNRFLFTILTNIYQKILKLFAKGYHSLTNDKIHRAENCTHGHPHQTNLTSSSNGYLSLSLFP